MTYSVIHIDGSKRGRYCGEFSPDEFAMSLPAENRVYNVCYQAAKAIGLHVLSGVNVSELKAIQPVKVMHFAWIHLQVQCVR